MTWSRNSEGRIGFGGLSSPTSCITAAAVDRLSIIGRNDAVAAVVPCVPSPILDWLTANVTVDSYRRGPEMLLANIVAPPAIAATARKILARQTSAR